MKIRLSRHFQRWILLLLPFLATAICWGTLRRDFALWRDGTPFVAYPLPAFTWDGSSVPYSYEIGGFKYEGVAELSSQDLAMLDELHDQPLPILYSAHDPSLSGQPGAGGRLLAWILVIAVTLVVGNGALRELQDPAATTSE